MRKYWAGELTDDPMPEAILHGVAYFPDWENPPFGSFAGKSNQPQGEGIGNRALLQPPEIGRRHLPLL